MLHGLWEEHWGTRREGSFHPMELGVDEGYASANQYPSNNIGGIMFACSDSQGCCGKGKAARRVRGGAAPRTYILLIQSNHQRRGSHRGRYGTVSAEKTVMIIPATRNKPRSLGVRSVPRRQHLHRLGEIGGHPDILNPHREIL